MKDRKQAARVLEANPTQCAQSNYDVLKTLNSVGEEYRDFCNHCLFIHLIIFTLEEGKLQKPGCYHQGTHICAHCSRGVRSPRVFLTADSTVAALFAFNWSSSGTTLARADYLLAHSPPISTWWKACSYDNLRVPTSVCAVIFLQWSGPHLVWGIERWEWCASAFDWFSAAPFGVRCWVESCGLKIGSSWWSSSQEIWRTLVFVCLPAAPVFVPQVCSSNNHVQQPHNS